MLRTRNPFTPSFGIVPPHLAGRDAILCTMTEAFESGLGNPSLCTLLIGPRGSGKTALLSCIGDEAREQGWIVVDVAAEDGMLEDIMQHAEAAARHLVDTTPERRLAGFSIGEILGLEWETKEQMAPNWRIRMEALLKKLQDLDTGLLITVDEVRVDVDEMIRLASAYQLFVRAGFEVALVMAGLPANVTELVEDKRVSFLRRARQHQLGIINDTDVARAFRQTIQGAGKGIEDDALDTSVAAAQGFPYMMQLVGYFMWAQCQERPVITLVDAQRGADDAIMDFRIGILDRTWSEMSPGDRSFAIAMLPDRHGSTLTDVAKRMGKGTNYASTYKKRLMRQGIIGNRFGGKFDFDIPLMREYLQQMD